VPSNKFQLNHNENLVEWQVDNRYFYRSQLIVLDLLSTNKWERPVYFAITCASESYFGLGDFFKLEGFAYRLTSTKKDTIDEQTGSVNSLLMYSNFMTKFDWSGLNKINSHEKLLCMNYRNNFSRLACALISDNKLDSARLVLDKCIEIIPNEIVYYDSYLLPIIECYYKLKEYTKANDIAKVLANNLNNNIDNYYDITIVTRSDNKIEAIKRLEELATIYNQIDILKLLKK
jgi:tetratricopeptide (TPR) repeat protein